MKRFFCFSLVLLFSISVLALQSQTSDKPIPKKEASKNQVKQMPERPKLTPAQIQEKRQQFQQKRGDSTKINPDFNNFSDIDDALKYAPTMKKLMMAGKGMKELSSKIGEFKELEVLDLTKNALTTLPDELAQLKKLKQIILQRNFFKEFPAVLTKIPSLEIIDFSFNMVESIPEEIGALSNLKEIKFMTNKLTKLPKGIGNLKSLKKLMFYIIMIGIQE